MIAHRRIVSKDVENKRPNTRAAARWYRYSRNAANGSTPISGTLIRAEQNTGGPRAEIWEINDPPASATANIDVVFATKARAVVGAVDFTGADVDTGSDDDGNQADSANQSNLTAAGR